MPFIVWFLVLSTKITWKQRGNRKCQIRFKSITRIISHWKKTRLLIHRLIESYIYSGALWSRLCEHWLKCLLKSMNSRPGRCDFFVLIICHVSFCYSPPSTTLFYFLFQFLLTFHPNTKSKQVIDCINTKNCVRYLINTYEILITFTPNLKNM